MIRLKTLIIKSDILLRLCEIDEFKGLWNGLDTHTTGLNLISDVAAHGTQFKTILEPLQKHDLSPKIVQTLHMSLCKDTDRGQFKTENNTLAFTQDGEEIGALETSSPEDAPILLEKLLDWTNKNLADKTTHPLLTIGIFAAIFLQIAPFQHHNQKLVKRLITLLMLKSGYAYAPFATLDSSMNQRAFQLYEALIDHQNSLQASTPEWSPWIRGFLDILIDQKDTLKNALQNKSGEVADMPALSIAIMDVVAGNKRTTMRDIMKQTKGKRSTIKLRLQELLDSNRIKRHGAGRSVWYSLI